MLLLLMNTCQSVMLLKWDSFIIGLDVLLVLTTQNEPDQKREHIKLILCIPLIVKLVYYLRDNMAVYKDQVNVV